MVVGVNYSPQAADLVRDGSIHLDVFKCPPWKELTDPAGDLLPRHIHSEIKSEAEPDRDKEDAMDEWLGIEATRHLNTHLVITGFNLPLIDIEDRSKRAVQECIDWGVRHVEHLQSRFAGAPVIIENAVPYPIVPVILQACCLPEVMHEILAKTGIGILIDFAHAKLTAEALGTDPLGFIKEMPLAHIKEVHVSGVQEGQGKRRDSMPMTEEDWSLTAEALAAVRAAGSDPWLMAFEYGGVGPKFDWRSDHGVLAEQCPRLVSLVKSA